MFFSRWVLFLQILTQEDWNYVLYLAMRYTSHWAAIYFIALMTFGNYVLFNLLVAILVEGFSDDDTESSKSSGSPKSIRDEKPTLDDIPTETRIQVISEKEAVAITAKERTGNGPLALPVIMRTAASPIGTVITDQRDAMQNRLLYVPARTSSNHSCSSSEAISNAESDRVIASVVHDAEPRRLSKSESERYAVRAKYIISVPQWISTSCHRFTPILKVLLAYWWPPGTVQYNGVKHHSVPCTFKVIWPSLMILPITSTKQKTATGAFLYNNSVTSNFFCIHPNKVHLAYSVELSWFISNAMNLVTKIHDFSG